MRGNGRRGARGYCGGGYIFKGEYVFCVSRKGRGVVFVGISYLVYFSRSLRICKVREWLYRSSNGSYKGSRGNIRGSNHGTYRRSNRDDNRREGPSVVAKGRRRGARYAANTRDTVGYGIYGVGGARDSVGASYRGSPSRALNCYAQGYDSWYWGLRLWFPPIRVQGTERTSGLSH